MVAPLIKRYTTGKVLSVSIWAFGGIIATIPLMEGFTQGGLSSSREPGKWNPYILFLIFPLVGIFHGIVELIRRVIPQDIVGGDETKLKRMDSTVHIWYEVAGTSGAVLSRYWIDYFKFAYALAVIPILFSVSGAVWMMLRVCIHRLLSGVAFHSS
ncbi:hypothetical protein BKA69DRAFT_1060014 [Paraphysoderma sedebokerense]|nr:hypothetical protein BKA69DRAFT_1060014 [Paraphysoderma sedebokerense]